MHGNVLTLLQRRALKTRQRITGEARQLFASRGYVAMGIVVAVTCALSCCGCGSHRVRRGGIEPPAASLLPSPGRLVNRPVGSSGCGLAAAARPGATVRLDVAVPPSRAAGARERIYWLHVPPGYRSRSPIPLVLAFHGAGGTGLAMQAQTGLSVLADQRGFMVAYPQGLSQPGAGGRIGWDASGPGDPAADGIDDGLFVSDLLNAVQARYCIDSRRIGAVGFSNGGNLTGYLACVLSGRVAAFAAVEAEFFTIAGGCHPAHPASILDVHAVTDPVAPYAGVPARGSPEYYAPHVPSWVRMWALRDGCSGGARIVSASRAMTAREWTGCDGGDSVRADALASGGHSWPRTLGSAAGSDAILAFLFAHALPRVSGTWMAHSTATIPALSAPRLAIRSLRTFHLPSAGALPVDVTAGRGGQIWFTEFAADKIGRIRPDGHIDEFRVPTPGAGPYQLAALPDGRVFFTEFNTNKIGRVDQAGAVSELSLGGGSTRRPWDHDRGRQRVDR